MRQIILYLIIFALAFVSCNENKVKPTVDNLIINGEYPSQESWDSKILFSEEGKIKAVLYADHLTKYDNTQESYLEGVKILFYNEEGVNTSVLTSDSGKVNDLTKNMYAINNVVAISDSGDTLTSDELLWVNKEKKIKTEKFVTIKSEAETIQGYGFESDQHLNNYVIYKITYVTTNNGKN
ncbi:MAG: LPS export ABC transporter periplasmic protein LptC [Ignavibacteria bacterium]|jgi:LPS export ABC transporter protein LptC